MIITPSILESIKYDYINSNLKLEELAKKYEMSESYLRKLSTSNNFPKRIPRFDKIYCNENYFESINTPSKAYFVGFIAGDGCIYDNYKELRILLNVNDIEILEMFKKELDSNHTIRKSSNFDQRTMKEYYRCHIEISREKLCRDLEKCNVGPNKSFDLKMPTNIPDELMCHYIRGILDSDGCWSFSNQEGKGQKTKGTILKNIRLTFAISTYPFAEELQDFLIKKCNLNKTKIQIKTDKLCVVAYVGNNQCEKIYNYIYGSGGPWLNRKYKLATDYFNELKITQDKNDIVKSEIHSRHKFVNKICSCNVCRLCNSVYLKLHKEKIYLQSDVISTLCKKYIDLYENSRKSVFYKTLMKEIKEIKSAEKINYFEST